MEGIRETKKCRRINRTEFKDNIIYETFDFMYIPYGHLYITNLNTMSVLNKSASDNVILGNESSSEMLTSQSQKLE